MNHETHNLKNHSLSSIHIHIIRKCLKFENVRGNFLYALGELSNMNIDERSACTAERSFVYPP